MRPFVRSAIPAFLEANAAHWNEQWMALKKRNPGAVFHWYRHQNQPVNQLLAPVLSLQTQLHCSYCDAFPMGLSDESIDHFKPKSIEAFWGEAYSWDNLYWACADCQKAKLDLFDQELLAPDEPGYTFERYFIYNFSSHEIKPNPGAHYPDQNRASITINIFQFNHTSQIIKRRHAWERRHTFVAPQDVEDYPFRFIFD
jgi:uncharacterized protein (TIGR02646 family)